MLSSLSGLNGREQILVQFAIDHGGFKAPTLEEKTSLSHYYVRKTIESLETAGILRHSGNGRGRYYYLNQDEETAILGVKLMLKRAEDNLRH